jgi:hypothetical protein
LKNLKEKLGNNIKKNRRSLLTAVNEAQLQFSVNLQDYFTICTIERVEQGLF